jgi:hypothetical protein
MNVLNHTCLGDRRVRRIFAAAFALGLVSQSVHARSTPVPPQSAPIVAPDPATFDFGSVMQGALVGHRYVLRNIGNASVRILGLELTPGLRLASLRAQLDPGQEIGLDVSMDTTGMRGRYRGTVTVRLNDPVRPLAVFTLTGSVIPPVEFRPYAAFFLSGDRRSSAEASIEIINHHETPLRINRIEHPVDRFTVHLDAVEEGRRYRLRIALRTDAAAGQREDVILLHTNDGRVLRVVANTRMRERVYTFPVDVDLGSLPIADVKRSFDSSARLTQTLMVYQVDGTDLKATFSTDVPGLRISAERGPNGDRWQATITLDPAALIIGPVQGSIVVETNDTAFPRLVVPVTGAILAN